MCHSNYRHSEQNRVGISAAAATIDFHMSTAEQANPKAPNRLK